MVLGPFIYVTVGVGSKKGLHYVSDEPFSLSKHTIDLKEMDLETSASKSLY
jgi:hypothetical protein